MATIKQKQAIKKIIENRGNVSKTMKEVGYSEATAKNPKNLTNSKGWKQLLSQIDDQVILDKIYEILVQEDKRSSLAAADMLLKLKDKYPQKATKLEGLFKSM